jgi:hypothetical protein
LFGPQNPEQKGRQGYGVFGVCLGLKRASIYGKFGNCRKYRKLEIANIYAVFPQVDEKEWGQAKGRGEYPRLDAKESHKFGVARLPWARTDRLQQLHCLL